MHLYATSRTRSKFCNDTSDIAVKKARILTIVTQYGTMQFDKYDEIRKRGYNAAVENLRKLEEDGKLSTILDALMEARNSDKKKGTSARRNSI